MYNARTNQLYKVGLMIYADKPPTNTPPAPDFTGSNEKLAELLGKSPDAILEVTDIDKYVEALHTAYLKGSGPVGAFTWSWIEPTARVGAHKILDPWVGKKISEIDLAKSGQDQPLWILSAILSPETGQAALEGLSKEISSVVDPFAGFFDLLVKIIQGLLDPQNWIRAFVLIIGAFLIWKGVSRLQAAQ